MMNYLKILFNRKMFLVTLILFLFYIFAILPSGINKTVSWNSIDKFVFYLKLYFGLILLFYTIVYSLLTIFKKNTSIKISVIHTLVLVFSLFVINTNFDDIILLINIVSIIVFLSNLIYSILKKE
jgi:hypothetical protein